MVTPDKNVKDARVLVSKLPAITTSSEYLVRYRIISDDGTQTSQWSPKYRVQKQSVSEILSTNSYLYQAKSHGKNIDLSWKTVDSNGNMVEIPQLNLPADVYVSWSLNNSTWTPWVFSSTTSSNSVSIPVPTQYQSTNLDVNYVKFMFHLSTSTKDAIESGPTHMFSIASMSTEAVYDSGTLS